MELSVTLSRPAPSRNIVSRHAAALPGFELSWSITPFVYNSATRYTGTYHDGTAYSNITAVLGGRLLAMKAALVASGWTVIQSSTSTHVLAGDLWTNAPDIERGTGHWIVFLAPDGVSQLVIQKNYIWGRSFYWAWSYGGLFTTGTIPTTRPTASDEVYPGSGSNPTIGTIIDWDADPGVGAFYACRGVRGNEISSRILQIDNQSGNGGRIEFMFCFEWFVTDLPVSSYQRNVCLFSFNTHLGGYGQKYYFDKDGSDYKITMPTSASVGLTIETIPESTYAFVSEFTGSLDSRSRMYPMYLVETSGTTRQFFGYLPDMYWGNNSQPLFSWFGYRTFGGAWSRYAELCIPYFATAYATNLGDSPAYATVIATANDVSADTTPPTFAGIVSAEATGDNTVRLSWDSGFDNVSLHANLVYEIHCSTSPSATFETRGEVVGTITHDVTLLKPGTTYYFRVRCRDEAGNVDANAVELSATTTGIPDITAPTVVLESPVENAPLSPTTPIIVRVTDAVGIRRSSIHVTYPERSYLPEETVHNGDAFSSTLFGGSVVDVLIPGKDYRYTIVRTGGWPDAPLMTVRTIDTSGNEIP